MREQQIALRDSLRRQIHDLQKQLEGVEMTIRAGDGETITPQSRQRTANVKQTLMSLLEEVGATGLNASVAVELAARHNQSLERGTVSSLLSRLKADDAVTYDGKVYRLKKFHSASSETQGAAMH